MSSVVSWQRISINAHCHYIWLMGEGGERRARQSVCFALGNPGSLHSLATGLDGAAVCKSVPSGIWDILVLKDYCLFY